MAWFVAVALFSSASLVNAITLDFANVTGSRVVFTGSGDTFTFTPAPGADQFKITSGGTGVAVGLSGNLGGVFTIGAITSVGGVQSASVTGSGALTIHDGLGNNLTGILTWDTISTFGTGGIINVNGVLNLSSLSYSGPNADLLALALPGVGVEAVSFQFAPGKTLTQLTANGAVNATSYSGTLMSVNPPPSVPDSGGTLVLLGISVLGLGFLGRSTLKQWLGGSRRQS